MNRIIDKIPLLLFSAVISLGSGSPIIHVTAMLTVVSFSAICQFSSNGRVSAILQFIYILLCIIYPGFTFFLPVILYDILRERRYYLSIAALIAYLVSASSQSINNNLIIACCICFCIVVQIRTSALETAEKNYIETRDNSVELTNRLNDKNKQLTENQDYEIHLATLKERNRIAREIHDNVGHMLSRSIIQLGAMQVLCKDEIQSESLKSLSETLNSAMTSIRQSVHDLHDESVDLKQSLTDAVLPLKQNDINVRMNFDFTDIIPNKIKFSFIGVVKEAVSNILKHSNADTVSLTLREHPAFYQLTIDDNGKCCGEIQNTGIGLENMRERIKNLGGIITITSDTKGFRIFISIKKGNVK